MMKKVFGKAAVPLSMAVRAGDYVYVSGQVPVVDGVVVEGGIVAQTAAVLDHVTAVLKTAGCEMSDVVKTFAILTDAGNFEEFNKVYATYFPVSPPARTTIEAGLMADIMVEIEAIAYKPIG
ncbi:RidA family protein [Novacetimonas hansenii]|uniref:RidA family protein n=1 Tax=Novacetimonas hansenii TaxID=436 RepID=UPI00094FCFBB|nr:RidA family protein [Novacetimonas hansenii]